MGYSWSDPYSTRHTRRLGAAVDLYHPWDWSGPLRCPEESTWNKRQSASLWTGPLPYSISTWSSCRAWMMLSEVMDQRRTFSCSLPSWKVGELTWQHPRAATDSGPPLRQPSGNASLPRLKAGSQGGINYQSRARRGQTHQRRSTDPLVSPWISRCATAVPRNRSATSIIPT